MHPIQIHWLHHELLIANYYQFFSLNSRSQTVEIKHGTNWEICDSYQHLYRTPNYGNFNEGIFEFGEPNMLLTPGYFVYFVQLVLIDQFINNSKYNNQE